ncbi:protein phosphatase 1 regulatory subunit 3A [Puntigrus tetrazona]|uniref:protein phosphatase 1 regulatory subunit 3A n=1 Tax=Puntigrus tetrazona TaxID=1606681 RepID=UPI001C892FBA|nr:protein phosphatase 1 regulatory subunit 3A [Puntigrus tetrazona]
MESVGVLCSSTGAGSNLLSLPASCPWEEDEESLGLEGIKPKSSPIPRRRSSSSSDDFLPPPSSSRRVSFADAFGLNLVSVKQFDAWGVTDPSGSLESDLNEDKEYYMVPLFTLPQSSEELILRVHEQKIELESLELHSGTTTLRGIVRVLNISFDKTVYVRTSLDSWKSHFDLLAEYVPGSNSGGTDCFSFKLTLVPPFVEEGTRVDFCLRYETTLGTFWANNNEKNYSLFCCEKIKEKPQNESENRRKSCLKTTSSNVSDSTVSATNNEECHDVHINSGSQNSEKLESKELVEINRNRSRRCRRKAARLAKVKEHFAKREEEKKQGTKTKEREVSADTSMQEHASLLEKTPCSSLSQQTARPPTCNQISPSPAESLKSAEYSGDSTEIISQALTEDEEDNIIHSKTNLSTANTSLPLEVSISCHESIACSASEVLEDIQHIQSALMTKQF